MDVNDVLDGALISSARLQFLNQHRAARVLGGLQSLKPFQGGTVVTPLHPILVFLDIHTEKGDHQLAFPCDPWEALDLVTSYRRTQGSIQGAPIERKLEAKEFLWAGRLGDLQILLPGVTRQVEDGSLTTVLIDGADRKRALKLRATNAQELVQLWLKGVKPNT